MFIRHIFTYICFVIFLVPAAASVEETSASRKLIKQSGLDVAMQLLHAGLAAAPDSPQIKLNPEMKQAWQSALSQTLTPKLLEDRMAAELTARITPGQMSRLSDFLTSPFGARVTELERQAQTPENREAFMQKGKELSQSMPDQRKAILDTMAKSIGARENALAITLNSTVALLRGMQASGQLPVELTDDQLRQIALQSRDQAAKTIDEILKAAFAITYAPLSDEELRRYMGFLRSEDGQVLYNSVNSALDNILSQAMKAFGELFMTMAGLKKA